MTAPSIVLPALRRSPAVFWILLAATALLMGVMSRVGAPLNSDPAPYGIVSYELAGSPARAQAILASWDAPARERAAFSLGIDYLFMVVYATTLALACLWSAESLRARARPLANLGAALAWGAGLAAACDAVENLALAVMLFGAPVSPWPQAARVCALVKFGLILVGIVYAIYALSSRLAKSNLFETPA